MVLTHATSAPNYISTAKHAIISRREKISRQDAENKEIIMPRNYQILT